MRNILTIVSAVLILYLAFSCGEKSKQEEIESRVKTKECYSKEDLEYIIFTGTQK